MQLRTILNISFSPYETVFSKKKVLTSYYIDEKLHCTIFLIYLRWELNVKEQSYKWNAISEVTVLKSAKVEYYHFLLNKRCDLILWIKDGNWLKHFLKFSHSVTKLKWISSCIHGNISWQFFFLKIENKDINRKKVTVIPFTIL